MTPIEFAEKHGLTVASEGNGNELEIANIYCCDLLSMVMGKAQENDALITVMGNVNTIAVGVLADVSCVILCENIHLDEQSLEKAKTQGVCIIYSEKSSFETALMLAKDLKLCC